MRIYLVASTAKNWQHGGYGQSLLAGDQSRLLQSFVEFTKSPGQQLAVAPRGTPYNPYATEKVTNEQV